jgi:hypothetical protein
MAYSGDLRFGRSAWVLRYDGCDFLVRHTETVSDAIRRALFREFPDAIHDAGTHEWRTVYLRSMQAHAMDTHLHVFSEAGSADAPPRMVADARVQRVSHDTLYAA